MDFVMKAVEMLCIHPSPPPARRVCGNEAASSPCRQHHGSGVRQRRMETRASVPRPQEPDEDRLKRETSRKRVMDHSMDNEAKALDTSFSEEDRPSRRTCCCESGDSVASVSVGKQSFGTAGSQFAVGFGPDLSTPASQLVGGADVLPELSANSDTRPGPSRWPASHRWVQDRPCHAMRLQVIFWGFCKSKPVRTDGVVETARPPTFRRRKCQ